MSTENKTIDFTRVNNDVNGNPRYVCHYLNLIPKSQRAGATEIKWPNSVKLRYRDVCGKYRYKSFSAVSNADYDYQIALHFANLIGGKKFHNKQYGGGIVFQSYNIKETERRILELVNSTD